MTVLKKFNEAEKLLNQIMYNRTDIIHGIILASLAGEKLKGSHVMMLGVPGTAKSLLARKFASMFDYTGSDSSIPYFELGFTAFTKPTDVFGPTDIAELKKSILKYKSENFLPNSRIFFGDEIGRGEKVLDSILTIMNERVYNVDGQSVNCPLDVMISASNQKITGSHYEALRDRFLQWFVPEQIDDDDLVQYVMNSNQSVKLPQFTEKELLEAKMEASNVVITKEIATLLIEIVLIIRNDKKITVSDRRIRQIIPLIKAEAWFNGRKTAIKRDLLVIWSTLWVEPEQIPTVRQVVDELAVPIYAEINRIKEDAILLVQEWKAEPVANKTSDVSDKLKIFRKKLNSLTIEPEDKSVFNMADLMIEKFQTSVANILVAEMHRMNI